MTISDSLPVPASPSLVSPFPSTSNAVNTSHSNLGFDPQSRSNPVKRSDTILFAGYSLLNCMSIKRMNVEDYRSVKLTKLGDSLDGIVNRVRNHLSKHCNTEANDLSRRQTTPFKSSFNCFDRFGISEHSLFQEQLDLIKTATGNTYNSHAASAFDDPALLWKYAMNDFIVKFLQDKKKYRKRRAKISADISARLFRVTCNKVSGILILKD